MRASTYENMMAELEGLDVPAEAKRQMADLLRRNAAKDGFKIVDRMERVNFARSLLTKGVGRPVVCERLMQLYGITKSSAHRDIGRALELSQISAFFGTSERLNEA